MRTLVVGGTGCIGGFVALDLEKRGHEVTIAARSMPADTPVSRFPFLDGDYVNGDFTAERLMGFDHVVFSACHDPRMLPAGLDAAQEAEFYRKANSVAIPRFVATAKQAGVKAVAYIGSFYAQAIPELVELSSYIRSRKEADEGARALADHGFRVVSLNAPWVVGSMAGRENPIYVALWRYVRGELGEPIVSVPGGVNFISLRSLSEAVIASLSRGANGTAYLVGDENLLFRDFLTLFADAAGRAGLDIPIVDAPHPIIPDIGMEGGRDTRVFYENQGVAELGYGQRDIARAVREICDRLAASAAG